MTIRFIPKAKEQAPLIFKDDLKVNATFKTADLPPGTPTALFHPYVPTGGFEPQIDVVIDVQRNSMTLRPVGKNPANLSHTIKYILFEKKGLPARVEYGQKQAGVIWPLYSHH